VEVHAKLSEDTSQAVKLNGFLHNSNSN